MPATFNPKGKYMKFAGGNRKEVFVQEGHLFNAMHQALPTDLRWLDQKGYAMNAELRKEVVRQQTVKKYQARKAQLEREIAEETARVQALQDQELSELYDGEEKDHYDAPPPSPKALEKSSVVLTSVEKKLAGIEEDVPEVDLSDEDDDEEDLISDGDLAPTQSSPNPFEGVDDDDDGLPPASLDPFDGKGKAGGQVPPAKSEVKAVQIRRQRVTGKAKK